MLNDFSLRRPSREFSEAVKCEVTIFAATLALIAAWIDAVSFVVPLPVAPKFLASIQSEFVWVVLNPKMFVTLLPLAAVAIMVAL